MFAQTAQHPREGFRGNAELRRNQALALAQCDAQGAIAVVLCMAQQPLGAAGLGVLRQSAHGQLRLLSVAHSQIMQQQLRRLGQGFHTAQKVFDGLAAQLDPGFRHHVHRAGHAQHGRSAIQPERAFNDTQLVAHLPIFEDAQLDPSAHQVQYRAELFLARTQHFARRHDLAFHGHFW